MAKGDKDAVVWSEATSYRCSPHRPWFFLHVSGTSEGCWNHSKLFVAKNVVASTEGNLWTCLQRIDWGGTVRSTAL